MNEYDANRVLAHNVDMEREALIKRVEKQVNTLWMMGRMDQYRAAKRHLDELRNSVRAR